MARILRHFVCWWRLFLKLDIWIQVDLSPVLCNNMQRDCWSSPWMASESIITIRLRHETNSLMCLYDLFSLGEEPKCSLHFSSLECKPFKKLVFRWTFSSFEDDHLEMYSLRGNLLESWSNKERILRPYPPLWLSKFGTMLYGCGVAFYLIMKSVMVGPFYSKSVCSCYPLRDKLHYFAL